MQGYPQSRLIILLISLLLAGCSALNKAPHPEDPFESFNRVSYQFNTKLDKFLLKPVASVYDQMTPNPVKKGVLNVFANLGEIPTFANDVLQAHPGYAGKDLWRFMINSTIGLGGWFDVATQMSLPRRYNDAGITLARWGIRRSPYLVIPFIGPSTVRDGVGLFVNLRFLTLWPYIQPVDLRNGLFALDIVSLRAALLDSEDIMQQAALDPYVFIRDAYLQKRANLIHQRGIFSEKTENLDADSFDQSDIGFILGAEEDDTEALEATLKE